MSDVIVPNGWRHEDNALRREFTLADFAEAFAFMTSIALMAEAADHHPDWSRPDAPVPAALTRGQTAQGPRLRPTALHNRWAVFAGRTLLQSSSSSSRPSPSNAARTNATARTPDVPIGNS